MSRYIETSRQWVERVVVGLNLCPFAKKHLLQGQIRFVLCPATQEEELLAALLEEARLLLATPPEKVETTLIIHPHILSDFFAYNDFLGMADDLLEDEDLVGLVQIASFHPDYQFADAPANDLANYTNRSPYPMLHLLREESVSRAVDTYPDVEAVPARNVALLRSMTPEEVAALREGE